MKCAWCPEPAVGDEIVIEQAVYKMVAGVKKVVRREKTAPACIAHRAVTDRQPPPLSGETATPARARADHHLRRGCVTA